MAGAGIRTLGDGAGHENGRHRTAESKGRHSFLLKGAAQQSTKPCALIKETSRVTSTVRAVPGGRGQLHEIEPPTGTLAWAVHRSRASAPSFVIHYLLMFSRRLSICFLNMPCIAHVEPAQ